jgi:ADP-ribose pyrophosphatase YjhB (NUDIX family)
VPLSHLLLRAANRIRTGVVRVVSPVRLGARVFAQRADGQVLFVRHSYLDGWWVPGGAVDQRETAAEGGLRELMEETGLHACGPVRLVGLHFAVSRGVSDHVAVLAVAVSGTPDVSSWEILEARFAPLGAPPGPVPPSIAEQIALVKASLAESPLVRNDA